MKLDQLQHFLETAKHQHIGKAANILRISPSGISYSIECLERDLGVTLFEKRGKRIFLTEAGRRLAQNAPKVQQSVDELKRQVSTDKDVFQGHYRLAASHLLSEHLLARNLGSLFKENKNVSMEVYSFRSAEVLAKVLEEEIDIGICFSPQEHPRLETRELHSGTIRAYVHPTHSLLREKSPVKFLASYPAILPKAFGGIEVCESHPVFDLHNIKPDAKLSFDDYGVGISLAATTNGWGFFTDWVESIPGFQLKRLKLPRTWKAPYTVKAVWLKDRFLDSGLRHILATLAPDSESLH